MCCPCEGQPETDHMLSALGEYAGGPGQNEKASRLNQLQCSHAAKNIPCACFFMNFEMFAV